VCSEIVGIERGDLARRAAQPLKRRQGVGEARMVSTQEERADRPVVHEPAGDRQRDLGAAADQQ
jgi:hypothetical protein